MLTPEFLFLSAKLGFKNVPTHFEPYSLPSYFCFTTLFLYFPQGCFSIKYKAE